MRTAILTTMFFVLSTLSAFGQEKSDFDTLKVIAGKMLAHRGETLMVKRQQMSPFDFELKGDGYSVTNTDSTGFGLQCEPEKSSGYKTITFEKKGKKYLVTLNDCRYDVAGVTTVTMEGGARMIMPKCVKTELHLSEKKLMDQFGDIFSKMFRWKPEVTK